jgi:16S rRNA (uracil1498-N3)-methyltransferase
MPLPAPAYIRPMARRRFFVDAVASGRARITGPEAHHLTRVLRVEAGQQFEISDNQSVYLAEVETAHKDLVSFAVRERLAPPEPRARTTILASLIRFERLEWILEKATELGVEKIVPVQAERSERGLERAAAKRMPRWNRIVREASEQARRAHLPEIGAPARLEDALGLEADFRYVLEESQAPPLVSALPAERRSGQSIALLVGPEGGWTERERREIAAGGWRPVSLGTNVLRAETAAIAALAIVSAAWEGTGKDDACGLV